jgi:hypothetical protein
MKRLIYTLFILFTFKIIAQVPNYVPTNGLVGWWPFNGNAVDESVNTNDGTVNGAVLDNDRFGSPNQSYSFNRSIPNEINITSSSDMNSIVNITISIWINLNSYGEPGQSGYNHYINKSDQNNNHHFVFSNNNDNLYFYYGGGNNYFFTPNLPPLNQWSHLAVTYNFNNVSNESFCKFYLNGVVIDSMQTSA